MRVRAYYIPDVTDVDGNPPWEIDVRVHTKNTTVGDVAGTSYRFAEQIDDVEKLVFLNEQVKPQRKAVVSISADEAYVIDTTEPPDDITTKANVIRLSGSDLDGLPVP